MTRPRLPPGIEREQRDWARRVVRLGSWLLVALVLMVMTTTASSDPDLWGHVRFGLDILRNAHVHGADPYSFTSDLPWINHEWMSEAALAASYRTGGTSGLLVLRSLLIAVVTLSLWRAIRRGPRAATGGADEAAALAVLVGGLLCASPLFVHLRPQMFSAALFSLLTLALTGTTPPRIHAVAPIFLIWANVHGGWLVGMGALVTWIGAEALGALRGRRALVSAGVTAAAALSVTLVNPYGPGLWRFLIETVRLERPDIVEWGAIDGSWGLLMLWSIVTAAVLIVIACARPRPRLGDLAVVALLAVASVRVRRIEGFYAIAAFGLLGPSLAALAAHGLRRIARQTKLTSAELAVAMAVTVPVLATGAVQFVAPQAGCIEMGPGSLAPDADAARTVAALGVTGRALVHFNIGQYVIWHFHDRLQVSVDGRRETVYSQAFLQRHHDFYTGGEDAAAFLRELEPDVVWLLAENRGGLATARQAGFVPVYEGAVSAVLLSPRGASRVPPLPPSSSAGRRCFPDF